MRAGAFITAVVCVAGACAENHEQVDPRCMAPPRMLRTNVSPEDDEPTAPVSNGPPLGGICDGSNELRLVIASDGPSELEAYAWRDRSARPFLIIDGKCHYYATSWELGPVTDGQLTAEMLHELTDDLALTNLANLPSRRDDCADHWSDRLLATQDHSLRCRCDDCGEGTPSTRAIANAVAWVERLAAEGKPLTGTLSAIAHPGEPESNESVVLQTVFDWPLEPAILAIENLELELWGQDTFGAYFSGDDAVALRRLRTQTLALNTSLIEGLKPFLIYVSDCGRTYALNMRDELPASVEAKLQAFLNVAWKRPIIPSCLTFEGGSTPRSPCPL
jgi:hypothetical protein